MIFWLFFIPTSSYLRFGWANKIVDLRKLTFIFSFLFPATQKLSQLYACILCISPFVSPAAQQQHMFPLHGKNTPSDRKYNRSISDMSDPSTPRIIEDSRNISLYTNLIAFTLFELETITKSFRSDYVLGEGGFGTVYKGYIDENVRVGLKSLPVAVKVLNKDGHQGHREWLVSIGFDSTHFSTPTFFFRSSSPVRNNLLVRHFPPFYQVSSLGFWILTYVTRYDSSVRYLASTPLVWMWRQHFGNICFPNSPLHKK